jgi:FkbM family methyltransferase
MSGPLDRLRARVAQRGSRLALLAAAAAQHAGAVPELAGTVELDVSFGTLYLHADDPVITAGLIAVGEWEPGETALLGAHIRPGMTVLDVGAHVGYYSVLAGRLAGPRGLVVAFEPNPRNYELLLANVWRNGLTNVVCFPWAVGERNGFAQLHLAPENSGDHRLYGDGTRDRVPVRTVALDALEALRPPVDVVKIDVQGAEEAVLRGAERLLAGSPDALLTIEFSPPDLSAFGSDERRLLDYYRSLGFGLEALDPETQGTRSWSDDEILDFCRREARHLNLVLTRGAS